MRPGPGPHMCGPDGRRMRRPIKGRDADGRDADARDADGNDADGWRRTRREALIVRAPVDRIVAPLFPTKLPWVNASRPEAT